MNTVGGQGTSKVCKEDLGPEEMAIKIFNDFRVRSGTVAVKTTTLLLSPTIHLSEPCWSAFGRHVRSFPGWYPTRRVASLTEKIASGQETRKGRVYFVSVTFDPAIVHALALAKEGKLPNHEAAKKFALSSESKTVVKKKKNTKENILTPTTKKVKVKEKPVLADISNTPQTQSNPIESVPNECMNS